MPIQTGTRLGVFEITGSLGAGGMGEVYRARDTQLNRDVAIKVLPDLFASDPERLTRFEREAQTLASLNHPHIAQIYGVEHSGTMRALVMELVDGEDLSQLIARGPVPLDDALAIVKQIADALDAAHERGIVHRDLKPANVKVRDDGTVKVLDFGLAKAMAPAVGGAFGTGSQNSPTFTSPVMTQMGVILGTAGYMAPEQARGKVVDKRADIWAFGCVLYELLTGRGPFAGDSVTDVIAAIVKEDPDWTALPPGVPRNVRAVLRECLQKDPKKRIRDIGDVRLRLEEESGGELPVASVSQPAPRRSSLLPWSIAALSVIAALVFGLAAWGTEPSTRGETIRLLVRPTAASGRLAHVLSPDGRFLVYQQDGQLYIHWFSDFTSKALPGTANAVLPFVSPDGKWIGFYADGRMKKVAAAGGNPVVVTSVDPDSPGAAWGADGRIYFSPGWNDSALMMVDSDGGTPAPVSTLDRQSGERGHWWAQTLPDGQHLLFTIWYAGAGLSEAKIGALDLKTGKHQVLFSGAMARYGAGHILYYRAGRYTLVPFDAGSLATTGEPVAVLADAQGLAPQGTRTIPVSFAGNGTIAYVAGDLSPELQMTWIARDGREEPTPLRMRVFDTGDLSPDGRHVAAGRLEGGTAQIWIGDLSGHGEQRLSAPGLNFSPLWHPDGQRLAFLSMRKGDFDMYLQRLDGAPEQPLDTDSIDRAPHAWAPDGNTLIAKEWQPDGTTTLFLYELASNQRSPLVAGPFEKEAVRVSPDGRWLAVVANPSGAWRIHVRPLTGGSNSFQQLPTGDLSVDAGIRWSPNSDEVFASRRSDLIALKLEERAGVLVGRTPEVLATLPPGTRLIGVSADGQRVLVGKPVAPVSAFEADIRVIINGLGSLSSDDERD